MVEDIRHCNYPVLDTITKTSRPCGNMAARHKNTCEPQRCFKHASKLYVQGFGCVQALGKNSSESDVKKWKEEHGREIKDYKFRRKILLRTPGRKGWCKWASACHLAERYNHLLAKTPMSQGNDELQKVNIQSRLMYWYNLYANAKGSNPSIARELQLVIQEAHKLLAKYRVVKPETEEPRRPASGVDPGFDPDSSFPDFGGGPDGDPTNPSYWDSSPDLGGGGPSASSGPGGSRGASGPAPSPFSRPGPLTGTNSVFGRSATGGTSDALRPWALGETLRPLGPSATGEPFISADLGGAGGTVGARSQYGSGFAPDTRPSAQGRSALTAAGGSIDLAGLSGSVSAVGSRAGPGPQPGASRPLRLGTPVVEKSKQDAASFDFFDLDDIEVDELVARAHSGGSSSASSSSKNAADTVASSSSSSKDEVPAVASSSSSAEDNQALVSSLLDSKAEKKSDVVSQGEDAEPSGAYGPIRKQPQRRGSFGGSGTQESLQRPYPLTKRYVNPNYSKDDLAKPENQIDIGIAAADLIRTRNETQANIDKYADLANWAIDTRQKKGRTAQQAQAAQGVQAQAAPQAQAAQTQQQAQNAQAAAQAQAQQQTQAAQAAQQAQAAQAVAQAQAQIAQAVSRDMQIGQVQAEIGTAQAQAQQAQAQAQQALDEQLAKGSQWALEGTIQAYEQQMQQQQQIEKVYRDELIRGQEKAENERRTKNQGKPLKVVPLRSFVAEILYKAFNLYELNVDDSDFSLVVPHYMGSMVCALALRFTLPYCKDYNYNFLQNCYATWERKAMSNSNKVRQNTLFYKYFVSKSKEHVASSIFDKEVTILQARQGYKIKGVKEKVKFDEFSNYFQRLVDDLRDANGDEGSSDPKRQKGDKEEGEVKIQQVVPAFLYSLRQEFNINAVGPEISLSLKGSMSNVFPNMTDIDFFHLADAVVFFFKTSPKMLAMHLFHAPISDIFVVCVLHFQHYLMSQFIDKITKECTDFNVDITGKDRYFLTQFYFCLQVAITHCNEKPYEHIENAFLNNEPRSAPLFDSPDIGQYLNPYAVSLTTYSASQLLKSENPSQNMTFKALPYIRVKPSRNEFEYAFRSYQPYRPSPLHLVSEGISYSSPFRLNGPNVFKVGNRTKCKCKSIKGRVCKCIKKSKKPMKSPKLYRQFEYSVVRSPGEKSKKNTDTTKKPKPQVKGVASKKKGSKKVSMKTLSWLKVKVRRPTKKSKNKSRGKAKSRKHNSRKSTKTKTKPKSKKSRK